jgi:hypothetical protein
MIDVHNDEHGFGQLMLTHPTLCQQFIMVSAEATDHRAWTVSMWARQPMCISLASVDIERM